jgi:hypothetical protein
LVGRHLVVGALDGSDGGEEGGVGERWMGVVGSGQLARAVLR